MELSDLEIYVLSRRLSSKAWDVYGAMDWQTRKLMGDQWIRSTDSVGANIAEGFGRFHYLDKNKFNFNARGSLLEAIHWTELLLERKQIKPNLNEEFKKIFDELRLKLNKYIRTTKDLAKE
jgi:four helix bundle protein